MPKKKKQTVHQLSREWSKLIVALNSEPSDRSVAIISAAYIDDIMGSMLRRYFCRVEMTSPLGKMKAEDAVPGDGEFDRRFKLCFALGMISPSTCFELQVIQQIRNKFAHRFGETTFDHESVRRLVEYLQYPRAFSKVTGQPIPPRSAYLLAYENALGSLLASARKVRRIPRVWWWTHSWGGKHHPGAL